MGNTPSQRHSGFALVEALIALLLVTAALLLGVGLIARQPRAAERLRAGDEALRAVEAALETIRAGALPLESGVLQPAVAYPAPATAKELLLDLEVQPLATEGLFEVTVEARFRIGQRLRTRRVQTLVWRPK